MTKQLVMGDEHAERIRALDRKVINWLAAVHPCPVCASEETPFPGCRLCDGTEQATGKQIELYARETRLFSLLPAWWPGRYAPQTTVE